MGARNTPEQSRMYAQQQRDRKKAQGYLQKSIFIHKDDWPRVKAILDERKAKEQAVEN